jgi:SOS-response transcriptional repressor LexA
MEPEQERIAAWMHRVMKTNNWSAEEWARKAKTSPTNLTRFLSSGTTTTSGKTLIKLATAAKSTPPLGPERLTDITEVPHYGDFMGKVIKGTFAVHGNVSTKAFAVEAQSDSLSLGGILPGDILVCEPESVLPQKTGALIAYLLDEEICVAKFFPPYLMPQSSNPMHEPVAANDVEIIGTVVNQVRDLR